MLTLLPEIAHLIERAARRVFRRSRRIQQRGACRTLAGLANLALWTY